MYGRLEMKRKAAQIHDCNDKILTFQIYRIRILFSIADIDAPQDPAFDDGEGGEDDLPIPIPPVRCSIVISKVRTPVI